MDSFEVEFEKALSIRPTPIRGLLVVDLPVHGDSRGWFKENWQRAKMMGLGLPDFGPVQNNISFNAKAGTTRGIHAEPWDKYVSIATGRIFGAWVDLREGDGFGTVFTITLDPSRAVFVPRGVGNAFQALEEGTTYTYLVNDHWSAAAQDKYTFLNLDDPTVSIPWPIPLDRAEVSNKDRNHPYLDNVTPMAPKRTLILGANGQLGRALQDVFPNADTATRREIDLASTDLETARDWSEFDTVINAAAYTNVDGSETWEGRREAWRTNVHGVSFLARLALAHDLTVVHFSSDYVFDGREHVHTTHETFSPLGVYGQTKAAGDAVVSVLPKHYIVRTSWVIGDGKNFISTMKELADKGVNPKVVNDQVGRITYARDLAMGVKQLLESGAHYGTYNITSDGEPRSWYEIAREVFQSAGHDPNRVSPITTEQYAVDKPGTAPRPEWSALE